MVNVKQQIECDFKEGKIFRIKPNGLKKQCGSMCPDGYLRFGLDGKMVYVHRYLYEQYHNIKLKPDEFINHINHKRDDNRIANLEIVSKQENCQYKSGNVKNKASSEHKHIYWDKHAGKWRVQIKVNGKTISFGLFDKDKIQDAVLKRNESINELNSLGHKYTIVD